MKIESKQCKDQVDNLSGELKTVKVGLDQTNKSTNPIANRLIGVENTFTTSFNVDGSTHFYYPVAIVVHTQYVTRSPLEYEIYRSYYEKAPDSLRPIGDSYDNRHYPALTFKFLANEGGWTASGSIIKVLFHQYYYNKTVAKIELGVNQDHRVIVWLRGGGILYHIKSPIDLTGKYSCDYQKVSVYSIKVYYDDNELACGNIGLENWPTRHVNPLPFGQEDVNLIKEGQYDGWAF